jgi:hypothetical protein
MNFSTFNCYEKADETFPNESFEKFLESTSFAAPSDFVGNVG